MLGAASLGYAQWPPSQRTQASAPAAVQLTSQQDHQRTMDLLRITSLRRGANGNNRRAPNAANYDESKANPYPDLPDPLLLKNDQKVTTAQTWWNDRRPEIVEECDREVYGRVPRVTPAVKWQLTGTTTENNGEIPLITKKLVSHVDNSSYPRVTVDIQLTLSTPAAATGPVPVMMEFGFGGFGPRSPGGPAAKKAASGTPPPGKIALKAGGGRFAPGGFGGGPPWQQQVLALGWGYAIITPYSIQADNGAGLTGGIIGLCNKGQPRKVDDWGALRGWTWGASPALDYFETDSPVDARRVGIEGHSRFGEAALVAMAYDPRFAIAFVSSSGEGGANMHRRNWGELVENVAATDEYHWMGGNFLKYAQPLNWNDLPVDSHELVALCAPRPVFIGSGATNSNGWADAKGIFLAAAGAEPVYRLLGKKDMGTDLFPPIGSALVDGDVAFRQHTGGHTPGPNCPTILKFADRYLKGPPGAEKPAGKSK
jgi:hypothetical protein